MLLEEPHLWVALKATLKCPGFRKVHQPIGGNSALSGPFGLREMTHKSSVIDTFNRSLNRASYKDASAQKKHKHVKSPLKGCKTPPFLMG